MKPAPPVMARRIEVRPAATDSHFGVVAHEAGMGDDQVPEERLQALGLRGDVRGRERAARRWPRRRPWRGDRRRGRRCRRRWRPGLRASSMASTRFTLMRRSASPPPTENTKRQSSADSRETLEPRGVGAVPALVVDAGRQLGDVVAHAVGLDGRQLAEVAGRVRSVAGAAAGTAEEEPPTPRPGVGEDVDDALHVHGRHLFQDADRVGDEPAAVGLGFLTHDRQSLARPRRGTPDPHGAGRTGGRRPSRS